MGFAQGVGDPGVLLLPVDETAPFEEVLPRRGSGLALRDRPSSHAYRPGDPVREARDPPARPVAPPQRHRAASEEPGDVAGKGGEGSAEALDRGVGVSRHDDGGAVAGQLGEQGDDRTGRVVDVVDQDPVPAGTGKAPGLRLPGDVAVPVAQHGGGGADQAGVVEPVRRLGRSREGVLCGRHRLVQVEYVRTGHPHGLAEPAPEPFQAPRGASELRGAGDQVADLGPEPLRGPQVVGDELGEFDRGVRVPQDLGEKGVLLGAGYELGVTPAHGLGVRLDDRIGEGRQRVDAHTLRQRPQPQGHRVVERPRRAAVERDDGDAAAGRRGLSGDEGLQEPGLAGARSAQHAHAARRGALVQSRPLEFVQGRGPVRHRHLHMHAAPPAGPAGRSLPRSSDMPNAPGAFPISAVDEHPGRRRSAFFHAG